MAIRISNIRSIANCDAVVNAVDAGVTNGSGKVEIRTGAAPLNCEDADTGVLLGTPLFANPAFGNAVDANPGGQATSAAITAESSANATGTAGHFRVKDRDNAVVFQGAITINGGGGDLTLTDINIVAGESIDITSFTFTVPEI